jgi:hypothetical protein
MGLSKTVNDSDYSPAAGYRQSNDGKTCPGHLDIGIKQQHLAAPYHCFCHIEAIRYLIGVSMEVV